MTYCCPVIVSTGVLSDNPRLWALVGNYRNLTTASFDAPTFVALMYP